MNALDVTDLVGYTITDVRRYHAGECTAEFTEADVLITIRELLTVLMDDEPTDEDCRAVLTF